MAAVGPHPDGTWYRSPASHTEFRVVLCLLADFFEARGEPFAIIGGLAMAAYGMSRTTLGVDVVAPASVQEAIVRHLEELGYETLYRSNGFSNHLHPDPARGRIDVVYVRGDTQRELFAAAREVDGPDRRLRVPSPEHLAALKLFAIRNDPSRTERELEDLRFLLRATAVDRELVRHYLERYDLQDLEPRLDQGE